MITLILGTVASLTANNILAPWRMMPCFSTALPTMKPGTSCRNTSGMLNASHSHTNRAGLSAAFTSSAHPRGLVGPVHGERAAEHHRLVRDDPDRPAVDAGEPGHEVLGPLGLHPQH